MLTELLFRGSDKPVPKCTLYHTHMHTGRASVRDVLTACLTCGEASQVALRRARSRSRYGRLELWADVRARYKRGIKLRVRTRKKINKEQGRNRDGRNWVPGALHVVVILGRSKRADHVWKLVWVKLTGSRAPV